MKNAIQAVGWWMSVIAGCIALVGCGGGGGSGGDTASGSATASGVKGVSAGGELTASQPGELLDTVKALIAERAKAGMGSGGGIPVDWLALPAEGANLAARATADTAAPSPKFSGSTIQEAGVDEDDLIKTDGNMIYSISYRYDRANYTQQTHLQAHQRGVNGVANKTATLELPQGNTVAGIYLASAAKRIAVLGSRWEVIASDLPNPAIDPIMPAKPPRAQPIWYRGKNKVELTVVAANAPASLPVMTHLSIDGSVVGTRLIGSILYLTTTWSPYLSIDALPYEATAEREAALAKLKIEDILPTIQIDSGKATPLFADTDCYVQTKNASMNLQVTTITAIDLNSPTLQRNSRCFLGGNEAIYVSERNVYLATTRYAYSSDASANWSYPPDITTDLHKFSINGLNVRYKASGEVKGHLGWQQDKKSYRLSEYNDDLRVITFTGSTGWGAQPAGAPSPATLTILREQADAGAVIRLKPVSTLPNASRPAPLGLPGEQIYAVRFAGDRGYVVTFRQIDPLYVLDLSNPLDPKTVGELKAPGFSDYLYPIGRNLLVGVGKDATDAGRVQGVKVGLIDVSDVQNPREIATRIIGKSWSTSALDYSSRGINLFTDGDITRIALPVLVRDENYVPVHQALYRWEVNAQAKTLADKPYVSGVQFPASDPWPLFQTFNVATERSVQIGAHVYYLTGGEIKSANWGDGTDASVQTIVRGTHSGVTSAQNAVVKDPAAWAELWARHTSNQIPGLPLPPVDFAKNQVAAVFLGSRSNGCYAVEITKVLEDASSISVEYVETVPQANSFCTLAITYPVHMVAISASGKPVLFVKR